MTKTVDMEQVSKALNPDFKAPEKAESKALAVVTEEKRLLTIIEKAATSRDIDVQKLSQLLELQERVMERQAEINFNQAMARLAPKLPVIKKTAEIRHNQKLISKYAKYEDIDPIIRPLYAAEGFSVSFNAKEDTGKTTYYGYLAHIDGHTRTAQIILPADTGGAKSAVQAIASTITYAKRMLVGMLFNLVFEDEDDDGTVGGKTIDTEQAAKLDKLLRETKSDIKKFCGMFGVERVIDIPAGKYQDAYQQIQNKINAAKKAPAAQPQHNGVQP